LIEVSLEAMGVDGPIRKHWLGNHRNGAATARAIVSRDRAALLAPHIFEALIVSMSMQAPGTQAGAARPVLMKAIFPKLNGQKKARSNNKIQSHILSGYPLQSH